MSHTRRETYVPLPEATLLPGGHTHIEIGLSYRKGGINYFTYKSDPRGYYLAVTPVTITESPLGRSTSFMIFSGTAFFLKAATRFSAKTLDALWAGVSADLIAAKYLAGDLEGIRAEATRLAA